MTALAVALLGAAAAAALALVLRVRGHVDPELWPWFVDEVEGAVAAGRSPQAALLAVAVHGPPGLRRPAAGAVAVWRDGGDPVAAVRTLQRTAGDPRLDRICAALRAAEAADGDVGAALAVLRAVAVADARHARRRRHAVRRLWIAAWLAPVLLVAARGADAGVTAAAAAVVVAWLALAAVVARRPPRVLDGGP